MNTKVLHRAFGLLSFLTATITYMLTVQPTVPFWDCGVGFCGTCTVLIDGIAERSCLYPITSLENSKIVTIEGLSEDGNHKVQKAWLEIGVSQCGYCQPGQILTAVALLNENPNPNDTEIDQAMSNNVCRCGTYNKIREAIHIAAKG